MRFALPLLACLATPVVADIEARFIEGAPKDRFVLTNTGPCATGPLSITIDLAGSAGALIFDTTGQGAGVEVFQPFELVSGADTLSTTPRVSDGDTAITLSLRNLMPEGEVAFTIDVDDTVSDRQITVSGSEIAGAKVVVGEDLDKFDVDATATVALDVCTS